MYNYLVYDMIRITDVTVFRWFYQFTARPQYRLSFQKRTSCAQKLPAGWQAKWRECVQSLLLLRKDPDLLKRYNDSRPGQPPVSILPPECISNRDQSPQLVSPLPNQSLAPKGTGECGIKTDGKEKERISTQFVIYGDGRKEQPYIIYHATEAPSEGIPKPNTEARKLCDRKDKKGEEYPPDVLLDCNPNAYFYVRNLKRTIEEGMSSRPPVLIETADAYRCHNQVEYQECCKEHGIHQHGIGGGLTCVGQPLDSAPNCIVHKHVRDENTLRMLKMPLNARGYPDPPSRPQLARWVKEGFDKVTPTIIMRCFIKCGTTRKCDYPAHVRKEHGLDSVRISPIIADLVADETDTTEQTVFNPSNEAPDKAAWMQDMASIIDVNCAIEDEMDLLRDLREEYEEIDYERGLQRVEEEEGAGLVADEVLATPVAEAPPPSSRPAESEGRSGLEPPKKRACIRYSKEQLAVLQREFDRGSQKLSNKEIAREIDMIPEGIGRKVDPSDVGNWMSANARTLQGQQMLSDGAGGASQE